MKLLRLSESFITIQGEGPKTGVPSLFVRFSGCDLRCPGWGVETKLPSGKIVLGCDSPHSVFPELYKDDLKFSAQDLFDSHFPKRHPNNIVITGGEPFMQPREELDKFITLVLDNGYEVEFFTNGDFPFIVSDPSPVLHPKASFVVDYKLAGTGQKNKFHWGNLEALYRTTDAIKFVIKDRVDYLEAQDVMEKVYSINRDFRGTFFMGPVWGIMKTEELIDWILEDKLQVRLNLQTQQLLGLDEIERTAWGKIL